MPGGEPGREPLAEFGHGIGPGDADRLEAEVASPRLHGAAQVVPRQDPSRGFANRGGVQKSRFA
jgi:hypothetical protein